MPLTLEATRAGTAEVRLRPADLTLWNVSHLRLMARTEGAGRPFFEVRTERGVVRAEAGLAAGAPGWDLPAVRADAEGWSHHTLACDQLRWPAVDPAALERPGAAWLPLPSGKVLEVRAGLLEAAPGARLVVRELRALRPSGNGVSPGGERLVMGRVVDGRRRPLPGVVVEVAPHGPGRAESTVTDRDGYYAFYRRRLGELLALRARVAGAARAPAAGPWLELVRDEAELDIELPPGE